MPQTRRPAARRVTDVLPFLLTLFLLLPAAAGPVISEFMASNQASLLDEDQEASDWIELHNPDPTPLDLTGWSLTDDPARLAQWKFPTRTLPPGGYLIVFASAKNRAPATPGNLHANFRLEAAGEYLALVQPDGQTIASEFRPTFPPQETDVSYGIAIATEARDSLASAQVAWLVPSTAANLPPDWTAPDLQPGNPWQSRPGPGLALGFDTTPSNPANTNLARTATSTATQSSTGFGFPADLAIDGDPDSFTHTEAADTAATWTLDLGTSHEISRVVIRNRTNCCQSRLRDITVTLLGADGSTVVWSSGLLNPENALNNPTVLSVDFIELNIDAPVARHLRIQRTPDPDLSGSDGLGNSDEATVLSLGEVEIYGVESLSFAPLIRTDLANAMRGRNSSAFVRIPFVLPAPASVLGLNLQLRHDDGVVAHLNGEEIATFNAPANPRWDTAAILPRLKSDALIFATLDLANTRPLWREGTNWLAFQVLNITPDDDDLLLDVRLVPELKESPGAFTAYLNRPTPGAANDGGWNLGLVADTKFSVDRGIHTNAFDLVLSTATPDAVIRYTVDGSPPTATTGQVYASPIRIDRTQAIRAAAFKPDHRPSNIDTHTYLFPADVVTQPSRPSGFPASWAGVAADYAMDPRITQAAPWAPRMTEALVSLPSVSIVTANDHLFGTTAGIYANPERSGIAWERPISLEWLDPAGRDTFHADCGLRIQGGYFRQRSVTRKHSLRLLFKNQYGPGRLRQDLFREFGAAREFDTLVLRAGANDGYAWDAARDTEQFTRDEFGRRTFLAMDQVSGRGRFVHVYLNGLYWGLYNLTERPAEDFSASYFGGDPANWDAINAGDVKNGSLQDWNTFLAGVRTTSSLASYQRLKGLNPDGSPNPAFPEYLDAPHYIDYMIVNLWGGNWDWPNKNFWFGRDRTGEAGGFKFYVWDFENTMGNNRDRSPLNMLAPRSDIAGSWVGEPHDRLRRSSAEYRMEFADRLQRHFFGPGALTPTSLVLRYHDVAASVEPAILAESARWGDDHWNPPQDPSDWQRERNWLTGTYLPQRSAIVLDQFRAQGLYPATGAPTLSPDGGTLPSGSPIEISAPAPEIFYTTQGIDPRLPGGAIHPAALRLASPAGSTPQPTANPDLVRSGHRWRYLASTNDPGPSWASPSFNDSAWPSGPSPLGYGDNDEATVVPAVDTQPAQAGTQRNATTLFRTTFQVPTPAAFQALRLVLTYDDAGAVFLNGREIARTENLPASAGFSTYASGASSDNALLTLTDLAPSLLVPGTNVLAVEIHQSEPSSSDISFDLELLGIPLPAAPTLATLNLGPSPVRLMARARNGTDWSALVEALFSFDTTPPQPGDLVIGEFHYRPAEPATPAELAISRDRDDFEFLELVNRTSRTLDLSGVQFTTGIRYVFPRGTRLTPGSRLLLVRNPAAFQARYGHQVAILVHGAYEGSLDNNGEELALVDAAGRDLQRFRYSHRPPWPDADGTGFSLVRLLTLAAEPGDPAGWRLSSTSGGNPGTTDARTFSGNPTADANGNGQEDLLDHAFGARIDDPVDGLRIAVGNRLPANGTPVPRVLVSYPRDPAAEDTTVTLLTAPSPAGPWSVRDPAQDVVTEERLPNGRLRRTHALAGTPDDPGPLFIRLAVSLTP